jgi:hypothetical protein
MKDCNDKHAVVTVFEGKIVVVIRFPTNNALAHLCQAKCLLNLNSGLDSTMKPCIRLRDKSNKRGTYCEEQRMEIPTCHRTFLGLCSWC